MRQDESGELDHTHADSTKPQHSTLTHRISFRNVLSMILCVSVCVCVCMCVCVCVCVCALDCSAHSASHQEECGGVCLCWCVFVYWCVCGGVVLCAVLLRSQCSSRGGWRGKTFAILGHFTVGSI